VEESQAFSQGGFSMNLEAVGKSIAFIVQEEAERPFASSAENTEV
jgi:hypothetical protein